MCDHVGLEIILPNIHLKWYHWFCLSELEIWIYDKITFLSFLIFPFFWPILDFWGSGQSRPITDHIIFSMIEIFIYAAIGGYGQCLNISILWNSRPFFQNIQFYIYFLLKTLIFLLFKTFFFNFTDYNFLYFFLFKSGSCTVLLRTKWHQFYNYRLITNR